MRVRLALLGALTLVACRPPPAAEIGIDRPVLLQVRAPDGSARELGGRTGRVQVMLFWASWCARCERAVEYGRQLTSDGQLDLHTVAVDADEGKMTEAAERFGVPEPRLWDPAARGSTRIGVRRVPTWVLVDRAGVVREVYEGQEPPVEHSLRRAAARLLAETARTAP